MSAMQNRHSEMPSTFEEAYTTSREMLADNPLTSTLVAFGAGAAIGVLLGHMLASAAAPAPPTASTAMEKLGRQVVDALRGSLPETIARHLPQ